MPDERDQLLVEQERERQDRLWREKEESEHKSSGQSAYQTTGRGPEDNLSLFGKGILLFLKMTGIHKQMVRYGQKKLQEKEQQASSQNNQQKPQKASAPKKEQPAVSESKSNVAQLSSGRPKRVVEAAKRTASRVANATKEGTIRSLHAGHLKRGFSAAVQGGTRVAAAVRNNITAPANKIAANGPKQQAAPGGPKGPGGR